MKEAITLDAWRHMEPDELRERRLELSALLLSITAVEGEDGPELLTRSAAGDAAAALAVAERLDAGADKSDDGESPIAWGWVALAAVLRGPLTGERSMLAARAAIAARLSQLAEYAGPGKAARLLVLAARWSQPLAELLATPRAGEELGRLGRSGSVAVALLRDREAEDKKKAAAKEAWEDGQAAVADTRDGRSLTVVREIAPGRGVGEDKQLAVAWQPLTHPLPLADGVEPRLLRDVLTAEFPWLVEAVDALVGDLEMRRGAGVGWAKIRPTLLVGPPGTGKTRMVKRFAELLGVGCGEINAAGASDNRLLSGTARGWSSASPSYVLHVMRRHMVANPVMVVDEIDKVNPTATGGDLRSTLLTMLEPESSRAWPDECLMSPCDLSAVSWVLTANETAPLKGPLLTRLRVVPAPPPAPKHFEAAIASIRRDVAAELGVGADWLPGLASEAEESLRRAFCRGHSLRRIRAAYEGAIRACGETAKTRAVN